MRLAQPLNRRISPLIRLHASHPMASRRAARQSHGGDARQDSLFKSAIPLSPVQEANLLRRSAGS
jgi:hypothetical protein